MKKPGLLKTFFRAFVSGGLATVLNFALLALFIEMFFIDPTLASAASFSIAMIFNYLCQYFWAFQASGSHFRVFARFMSVNLLMLGVNTGLFWFFYERVGFPYPIAQTIAIGVVFLCSFTINRAFTFKSPVTGTT